MIKIILVIFIITLLIAFVISSLSGAGGFARMTTISGIYTVKNPDGYPVVCFLEKSSGAIFCIPESSM